MEKYKSKLKKLRIDSGITQDQLAYEIDISRKTIAMMETYEGCNPRLSTIKRLIKYFNVSFEDLFPEE